MVEQLNEIYGDGVLRDRLSILQIFQGCLEKGGECRERLGEFFDEMNLELIEKLIPYINFDGDNVVTVFHFLSSFTKLLDERELSVSLKKMLEDYIGISKMIILGSSFRDQENLKIQCFCFLSSLQDKESVRWAWTELKKVNKKERLASRVSLCFLKNLGKPFVKKGEIERFIKNYGEEDLNQFFIEVFNKKLIIDQDFLFGILENDPWGVEYYQGGAFSDNFLMKKLSSAIKSWQRLLILNLLFKNNEYREDVESLEKFVADNISLEDFKHEFLWRLLSFLERENLFVNLKILKVFTEKDWNSCGELVPYWWGSAELLPSFSLGILKKVFCKEERDNTFLEGCVEVAQRMGFLERTVREILICEKKDG
jgi:hypothetical protein